jgi:uncharacterized protein (UPF0332 family)
MTNQASIPEIDLYIQHAHQMLDVAKHNIRDGFYGSAINRAYYAVFYAASALLRSRQIIRGKHSAVIAGFRQYFVKSGKIEAEYSDIYGRVMENRHTSDYEIELPIDAQVAAEDVKDAQRFVERIETYLREEGWL